jgi:CP family cyanate transporter-like MFS transporter
LSNTSSPVSRPALLIAGVLLIAATLRAPITGIAPVLDMIRDSLSLGTAQAGILTTLPLLAFALVSPVAVVLARRFGLERSLFGALLLIAGGVALRPAGAVWSLFAGTAVIGIGVAIANVLLPSLLKRDFPTKIALVTSAYAMTAGIAAALASVMAVPIASLPGKDWRWALGAFEIFPLAALAAWTPQLANHTAPAGGTTALPQGGRIWHSPLAWQVTFFFGLNSLVYYVVVAWLPAMLMERGYSAAAAGSLHGISQVATAIPGFLGPLIGRLKDQKIAAAGLALVTGTALFGFFFLPAWAPAWTALFGFGTGATFILGLSIISLRAGNARQAASLSGMVQCVGYLVAASAPPLAGLIHDRSHGWQTPLMICCLLCGVMAAFGYRAGRPIHLFAEQAKSSDLGGATQPLRQDHRGSSL